MSLEEDPFAVTQKLEIQSILQRLLHHRTLLRLDVPKRNISIISTILELNPKDNTVLLDNATDDLLNNQLLQASVVRVQGMLDHVLTEFSGELRTAPYDGKPAFAMPVPEQLRRIQRREFFRILVPRSNPATCTLPKSVLPDGAPVSFALSDINAGGLQLLDESFALAKVELKRVLQDCQLNLPGTGAVEINLKVLRKTELEQADGRPVLALAGQFFNLPINRQITIQKYIGTVERAAMAKRWGIE